MLCVFIITLDKIMAIGYNLIMQKIVVSNQYFSVKDTLTCGQVFRFKELPSGEYEVVSRDKRCFLKERGDVVEIASDDVEYFTEYFDLKRDYAKIVSSLSGFDELRDCVNYGKGIRILRQDFDETLFSFIVSANNNIRRIQGIIEGLSEAVGDNMGEFYAFPTAEQFRKLTVSALKGVGLGYRAEYIYDTARAIDEAREGILTAGSDEEIMKKLLALKGVGPKVANCIMLFGLSRTASYPVDTWIFKAGKTDELDTPKKVQEFYQNRYGELAGFAQQYIFHYARNVEQPKG